MVFTLGSHRSLMEIIMIIGRLECQTRGHGAVYIKESVLDWGIGHVLYLIYVVFYSNAE
jgi:hypothetical protein